LCECGERIKRQSLDNGVIRFKEIKKRRDAAEIPKNIATLKILQNNIKNFNMEANKFEFDSTSICN